MKANQAAKRPNKGKGFVLDRWAAVGIGTMIVFIASVLVAAIAAAVLLDTSGKLQEKSARTGQEATKEVASNLIVKGIRGTRPGTTSTDYVNWLNISVALAPGAESVDLGQMIIQVSDGSTLSSLNYTASTQTATRYNATAVRDADNSFSTSAPVLTAGDLVDIKVSLKLASMTLQPRKELDMTLVPEVGSQVGADIRAPASYGSDTVVVLR